MRGAGREAIPENELGKDYDAIMELPIIIFRVIRTIKVAFGQDPAGQTDMDRTVL